MFKRLYSYIICAAVLVLLPSLQTGCSKSGDDQQTEEKSGIERMTDQAAETVEKKIRTPMDKARSTRNLGDERVEQTDRALQKQ